MTIKMVITIAVASVVAACSSMPGVTRTGEVKNVLIKQELSAPDLNVQTGDEIRWTNRRQAPVRIVFLQPIEDRISCRQNFSGTAGGMGLGPDNSTTLAPNESASLCFSKPGSMHYTVRMESALPTGEVSVPGSIEVEDRVQTG